ncbi:craniofacial development protein 2-like [Diadema antillarum]|uniref:craniofacial development protein 2-like n=1 Tax=Diadema antillarum TaxID=105358 RepID=UPI003A86C5BD
MDKSANSTRVKAPNSVKGERYRYDSTGSKPSGRPADDGLINSETNYRKPKAKRESVLSCRRTTKIGTLNVRTIRTGDKREELGHLFEESGLQILAIQEHRILHEEPIRRTRIGVRSHLITTSAVRNSAQAAVGGVGFMISMEANKLVREVTPVSHRILKATFNGNPRLTVFAVYSPTEGDSIEHAEEFHEELCRAVTSTPMHNILLVLGDFNAHLSKENKEDTSWYYHNHTNRNGGLLKDTLLETNLEVTNLRYRKKPGKMWTYLSDMHLSKSQIDFILVRKKWRNSVMNTEAYDFFNSLGSDHRLVMAEIRLSLRKVKAQPKRVEYDWEAFKEDTELQKQYSVEVKNRFSALCKENDTMESVTDKVSQRYGHFVSAIAETNKTMVPKKEKEKEGKQISGP